MVSVAEWRKAKLISENVGPESKPRRSRDGAAVTELLCTANRDGLPLCMSEATLLPRKRTALVQYRTAEVLCYILGGRGTITVGNETHPVARGQAVHVPPMTPHRFEVVGGLPLRILRCFVPACTDADAEILEPVPLTPGKPLNVLPAVARRRLPSISESPITPEKLVALRKEHSLSQTKFWARVFVTQSGGSRYESGHNVPRPVQLLLRLIFGSHRDARAFFDRLRRPFLDCPTPKLSLLMASDTGDGLIALRKALRLNQAQFWAAFGVTQSGGSRYETGREFSEVIHALLRLLLLPEPSALKLLETMRSGEGLGNSQV